MGNVQVQWPISADGEEGLTLTGAVQQSFTPRETQDGQQLRVQISYVDGQGKLEARVGPAPTPVRQRQDQTTGAPRPDGGTR